MLCIDTSKQCSDWGSRCDGEKRVRDSIYLQQPDRIPLFVFPDPRAHYGLPQSAAYYDPDAWREALIKEILDFARDFQVEDRVVPIEQKLAWLQRLVPQSPRADILRRSLAESRIVRRAGRHWSVEHGPFTRAELGRRPARDWTVLVQDTNHFVF